MSFDADSTPLDPADRCYDRSDFMLQASGLHSAGSDERSPGEPVGIPEARPAGHPLGPLGRWEPLDHPLWSRLYAAGVALVAIALLVTAARLTPDSHQMGTHQQLGLPPCGFVTITGLPCPTCGMTTAFADAVRGRVLAAVRAQAAGFALAVATAVAGVLGTVAVVTGRRFSVNWYRVNPTRLIWLVTLGFLLAWGLKIVLGLMNRTLPVH